MRSLAFLLALLPFASPLAAEPAALSEEISVELVNVDVHVAGKDGHPVAGLTPEDFRLFENDEPVTITHFAWVPPRALGGDEAPSGAGEVVPSPARNIAIFFDELQVGDRSRIPLIEALRERLAASLASDDRVSVIRYDGAEIEVLLPWTGNRTRLLRALDELSGFSARKIASSEELRSWLRLLDDDIKGGPGKGGGCPNTGGIIRSYADLVHSYAEASASALLRYANRLSQEPGQRILLHVSDGIPLVAGGEAYEYAIEMCNGDALAKGEPGAFSVYQALDGERSRFDPFKARLEMNEYQMAPLWTDVAARINALGVTVYPIQTGEAGASFAPDIEGSHAPETVRSFARQNPVDTIALLARETGGLLIDASSGAEASIDRLLGDLGGYYSLAFAPARDGKLGQRRLRVEVDRAGLRLRYRQSYRRESRDERVAGQLAELFAADRIDNPLDVRIQIAPASATEGPRLSVSVPYDRLTMIDTAGERSGRFTLYLAIRSRGGRLLPMRQHTIDVRRDDPTQLAHSFAVGLPREQGEVALAILDDFSGSVAFARARLPER